MTYLEKIHKCIRLDMEILTLEDARRVRTFISEIFKTEHPTRLCCPGIVFDGAPTYKTTGCIRCCRDCWNQEAE